MKVAIHHREGSFSNRWIAYCQENGIDYIKVNAYDSDIINQVKDCDAFMWHFYHGDYRDMQFAKALLFSLQEKGLKVFPDINTCWHFDNKIYQKYLLEAIDAPLVPSYVFYTKKDAMDWVKSASFPKVFKLKGGAGSVNVKLVKSSEKAIKLINESFSEGFSQYDIHEHYKEALRRYKQGTGTFRELCRPIFYRLKKYPNSFSHYHGREMGYVYFQDYIPNNTFDIRICVVGDKAFGIKRVTRNNDFRASGSGIIEYDKEGIDERCVELSFTITRKLKMQSVGIDFIFNEDSCPMIVEISYGYSYKAYTKCSGYWTSDMKWHPGTNFDFAGWMVEDLLR